MTAQEMAIVQKSLKKWREAKRIACASARNNRSEQSRVEAEIELIAGELAEMGIDWRSDEGMCIAAALLRERLGLDVKEPELRFTDDEGFPCR